MELPATPTVIDHPPREALYQARDDRERPAPRPPLAAVPTRSFADWFFCTILILGVIGVTVASLPYRVFELDRYTVPKELVLHETALCGAIGLLFGRRPLRIDVADGLIALFAGWSLLSAFFADNLWLAQRAIGLSVSSVMIFWMARRVGASGLYRPLLAAAGLATTVAAVISLIQAYGIDSPFFSLTRAPGGTFGNRNFVAHFAAIGLPALAYFTLTAGHFGTRLFGTLGTGAVVAALVLTRSRAAWLALLVSVVIVAIPLLLSRKYWRGHSIGRRCLFLAAGTVVAGASVLVVPNRLNWRSDSPYLDSARGLVDYTSGSGQGRVAQYRNSLRMTAANPVIGVGPGNWPVHYPRFVPSYDRSLSSDGMTANPWPSSDWIAHFSERGVIATIALLGVFAALTLGSLRRWRELPGPNAVLAKLTLLATLATTFVVSAFDAVLLLPAPAFLAMLLLGAASGVGRRGREITLGRGGRVVALLLTGVIGLSLFRSATQTMALSAVGRYGSRDGWIRAAALDPGSYRINMRVADLQASSGRCAAARAYARRAAALFPHAPAPKQLLRRCG